MTAPDDDPHSIDALHEQTLRHLGRRLFEEARAQSEAEDAEVQAWTREHRERHRWWGRSEAPMRTDTPRDEDPK